MNLIADENIDRSIVVRLRMDGHDVASIAESTSGVSDDQVLQFANQNDAVLLTEDKDFGELVYRRGAAHAGILLIRLEGLDNPTKAEIVSQAIRDNANDLTGAFAVLTPDRLRLRRPDPNGRTT